MARSATDTFADGLYRLLQEVATLKAAPDADLDFLGELENMVLTRYKSSSTTPGPGQPTPDTLGGLGASPIGAEGMGMGGGAEPPIPVSPVEPLSRGPAPSPDLTGAISELDRLMAGA